MTPVKTPGKRADSNGVVPRKHWGLQLPFLVFHDFVGSLEQGFHLDAAMQSPNCDHSRDHLAGKHPS